MAQWVRQSRVQRLPLLVIYCMRQQEITSTELCSKLWSTVSFSCSFTTHEWPHLLSSGNLATQNSPSPTPVSDMGELWSVFSSSSSVSKLERGQHSVISQVYVHVLSSVSRVESEGYSVNGQVPFRYIHVQSHKHRTYVHFLILRQLYIEQVRRAHS